MEGSAVKKDIDSEEDVIRLLSQKTPFERDVLVTTFKIPRGKVSTYKRIAERVGRPNAYRAVGNALHRNPLAPIVPCHRVVRSDGEFGGEREGAEQRKRLLATEGIPITNGRVTINEENLY